MMQLVRPTEDHLSSYVAALEGGWSPNNERGLAATLEELALIRADAPSFVRSLDHRNASGAQVTMPDGSTVPRLPGFRLWMWDGEFAGSIGFRWQQGTTALPPCCKRPGNTC